MLTYGISEIELPAKKTMIFGSSPFIIDDGFISLNLYISAGEGIMDLNYKPEFDTEHNSELDTETIKSYNFLAGEYEII